MDGRDTTALTDWLESEGDTHHLVGSRRTGQEGLLAAAQAVRNGQGIQDVLTARTFNGRTSWTGQGFRLFEAPATTANTGLLAWSIANEMTQRAGAFAILTPDAGSPMVRGALSTVGEREWTRKNSGATFGPFPHRWERHDTEEAKELIAAIELPEIATFTDLTEALKPHYSNPAVAMAVRRADRLRRVTGQVEFSDTQFSEFITDAVKQRSRMGNRHWGWAPGHDYPSRQKPGICQRDCPLAAHRSGQR